MDSFVTRDCYVLLLFCTLHYKVHVDTTLIYCFFSRLASWRSYKMVQILLSHDCVYTDSFLTNNPQILAQILRYQDAGHQLLETTCSPVLQEILKSCSTSGLAELNLGETMNALVVRVTMDKQCLNA